MNKFKEEVQAAYDEYAVALANSIAAEKQWNMQRELPSSERAANETYIDLRAAAGKIAYTIDKNTHICYIAAMRMIDYDSEYLRTLLNKWGISC